MELVSLMSESRERERERESKIRAYPRTQHKILYKYIYIRMEFDK